jgi:ABC-type transport system involved in multi-copper enzyme maturation permease subunit
LVSESALAYSSGERKPMRSLLLRSLLVAILIGPIVTFLSAVASVRTTVKYEPGLSEAEFKSYDNRTVSELEAFMKSREVKFTRYQWLRESIGTADFWKGIAWSSLGPSIGIFLGCVVIGRLERREV